MLKTPHHATIAKAKKLGYTVEVSTANNCYVVIDEAGRTVCIDPTDSTRAVNNARTLRMIKAEHPKMRCVQDATGKWTIYMGKGGKKPLAQSMDLEEAFADAADAFAPTVKAKPAKPAKRTRDEDEDEDEGEGDEGDEGDEDEDNGEGGRSVVRRKYRTAYKPHQNTCGDELTSALREYIETDNEDGTRGIDLGRLRRLAEANNVWKPEYSRLNPGMQRMNVGNRLRGLVRKGTEIIWP